MNEKPMVRQCCECKAPLDEASKIIMETKEATEYTVSHGLCPDDSRVLIAQDECAEKLKELTQSIREFMQERGFELDEKETKLVARRVAARLLINF